MANMVLISTFLVAIITCSCHVSSTDDPLCEGVPNGICRYSTRQLADSAEFSQRSIAADLRNAMDTDPKPIACYVVSYSGRPRGPSYSANAYFSCNQAEKQCRPCFYDAVQGMKKFCNGAAGAIFSMEHCCLSRHVSSTNDPMCEGVPDDICRYSTSQLVDSAEFSQRTIVINLRNAMDNEPKPIACYVVSYSGKPGGPSYYANAYFSCNQLQTQCLSCFYDAVDGVENFGNGAAGAIFAKEHCCLRAAAALEAAGGFLITR
ncbi:hypothetical protein LINPERPRIM_LOCUS39725 [Linum perenne]